MTRFEALAILSKNFATMPSDDPSALATGFAVALEGHPDWAVIRAVQAFLRGEVEGQSLTYRPAPPMLVAEVKRQVRVECNRQNEAIIGEQRALKADGKPGYFKHRADEMVTAETVNPNDMPALPADNFKRLIEHRVDPTMQAKLAKVLPFKPVNTQQEAS
jgi:hypothetical protein